MGRLLEMLVAVIGRSGHLAIRSLGDHGNAADGGNSVPIRVEIGSNRVDTQLRIVIIPDFIAAVELICLRYG
ncbi:hypothetical protein ABRQ00_15335 [Pectobacterium aroidearum]|uniref:hypothetical protein n=1 Tax=Pectobacterium TaxID=122277 RepID=UPI001886BEB7|nr:MULTISPECIES: hypothetical protein [Pectobacterium]MDY4388068.1 hypothetical protein [Pectobacterium aroidearum]WKA63920.1 hypothetical protein QX495_07270 [Pectobacterium aroidearum]